MTARKKPPGLTVFEGLPIPVEYASVQTYAILGKRDSGKTYLSLLFEEQAADAGLFYVVLDPVGKHWALRAPAAGRRTGGKDVWVLGGQHGDVPLEPASGELIADVVVDHPGRYVLDVSGFETDAEQDRFAADFARRLFRRKAQDPGWPLLVILEEAESFIPQNPQPGQQKMLGAYARIVRQGRNHGLGLWMVAQRAQALNKGVLSQAEALIVKQMAHNRDIGAVDEWVKANGTPEERQEMLSALASLGRDEAFVWSPSWLRTFKRTRVLSRVTFDSSASARAGDHASQPKITPLDVAALGEKMAATRMKADAESVPALRKQIADLRQKLEQAYDEREAEADARLVEGAEAQVVDPELAPLIAAAREAVESVQGRVADTAQRFGAEVAAAIGALSDPLAKLADASARATRLGDIPRAPETRPKALLRKPSVAPAAGRAAQRPQAAISAPTPASPAVRPADLSVINPGRQKLLDALADFATIRVLVVPRGQLAAWAGVRPSSGNYTQNLAALNVAGLIDYPSKGHVALTDAGRALAVRQFEGAVTTEAFHEQVRGLLKESQWRIVEALIAVYPESLHRAVLAESIGVRPSSGNYTQNVAALNAIGFVNYPQPGWVVASDLLFLD